MNIFIREYFHPLWFENRGEPVYLPLRRLCLLLRLQVAPADHPKGTTWVWDDGSGVVMKAENAAKEAMEQRQAQQKEEVNIY